MSVFGLFCLVLTLACFALGGYMTGRRDAHDYPYVLSPGWVLGLGVMWLVVLIAEIGRW